MVKMIKTEKQWNTTSQAKVLRYVVKYKVRKMAECLLKLDCYCPMLLMGTTKTGPFSSPLWGLIGALAQFHE